MILIINTGSTTVKFKLFSIDKKKLNLIEKGQIVRISSKGITYQNAVKEIATKVDKYKKEISEIGYRIVHGCDELEDGVELSKDVITRLNNMSDFASLHNPAALKVILELKKIFKDAIHLGYFDTSFYKDMPSEYKYLPIPNAILNKYSIKKVGFHGISHQYVYDLTKSSKSNRVISVHLGSGNSITAIKKGKPIENSMTVTPLSGLIMESRSGDLDPGLVIYLLKKLGVEKVEEILNKKSGLKALTQSNGNMLDILYLSGNRIEDKDYTPQKNLRKNKKSFDLAKLGLKLFTDSVKKYIGAYSALLGGVDTIIFTGAIGYGSKVLRNMILNDLDYLKIKNVEVVETDEEKAIAMKIIKR